MLRFEMAFAAVFVVACSGGTPHDVRCPREMPPARDLCANAPVPTKAVSLLSCDYVGFITCDCIPAGGREWTWWCHAQVSRPLVDSADPTTCGVRDPYLVNDQLLPPADARCGLLPSELRFGCGCSDLLVAAVCDGSVWTCQGGNPPRTTCTNCR